MSPRSMSRRTFAVSAAVAPLAGTGIARAGAGGDWVRTETPNFVLYGNVGEKTVGDFARDLEDFDGLLRLLHGVMERSDGRPLPIYLVGRRSDLSRVQPDLDQAVNGYYSASIGDVFAVMSMENGEDRGRGSLFHEYTHHFMSQHAPAAYPSWLVEGYAEYFRTTRFKPDVVELGVTNERIAWLRGRVWEPYDQILGRRALEGDHLRHGRVLRAVLDPDPLHDVGPRAPEAPDGLCRRGGGRRRSGGRDGHRGGHAAERSRTDAQALHGQAAGTADSSRPRPARRGPPSCACRLRPTTCCW
jgi:hypothetical protein